MWAVKFFLSIAVGALCIAGITAGVAMIFGSFFFEQTWTQMTWAIAGQHLLMFLGGAALVAVASAGIAAVMSWVKRHA